MSGRRARYKPGAAGGSAAVAATQPLSFSIPLKDTSKPVAFPANFQKHIALEFAMRYLCEIGATPTMENCRVVLKEMPLEACSVTAAWRSRGCLADAIIIQPGGHQNVGGAGGSLGEALPPPAGGSLLANVSSGNGKGGNGSQPAGCEGAKDAATERYNNGDSEGRKNIRTHTNENRRPATTTQPASSMGKASPHKVSVFVDAVSSAILPVMMETTTGKDGAHRADTAGGAAATLPSPQSKAATTTARDRNAWRRQNGDLAMRNTETSCVVLTNNRNFDKRTQRERGHQRGRQASTGASGDGVSKIFPAALRQSGGVGGDVVAVGDGGGGGTFDEQVPCDAVEFAQERRKMLDPPKVGMSAIATVQAAFARNFAFHKHGEKFKDISVRSSLKNIITSEGPGRLIGLLSHYLYWIMLLPFVLAHKDRDDCVLLKNDYRLSMRKQKSRVEIGDASSGGSSRALNSGTTVGHSPRVTTATPAAATSKQGEHESNGSNSIHHEDHAEEGTEQGPHQHPSLSKEDARSLAATSNRALVPPQEAGKRQLRPELASDEAESLFVAVVESWSSLRSSLGASRQARLVHLPIAVAAVRHGVQTVLCNCYPFLDTKGGREGKRLLASLHEEVATRFIPRFYYEGPFTPVAEEEKEDAENMSHLAAVPMGGGGGGRAPAPTPCKGNTGIAENAPPPQPSTAPRLRRTKNFLEASATLLAARRRAQTRLESASSGAAAATASAIKGWSSTAATLELGPADEVKAANAGKARTATQLDRDRPGGARRTGEALFATSTTLGYVFPYPCRARARSSRAASRTTTSPTTGTSLGYGFAKTPPRAVCCGPVKNKSAGPTPPSQAASTPGARVWPMSTATGDGETARGLCSSSHATRLVTTAVTCTRTPQESRVHGTAGRCTSNNTNINAAADNSNNYPNEHGDRWGRKELETSVAFEGARRQLDPQKQPQKQLSPHFRDATSRPNAQLLVSCRGATGNANIFAGRTTRVRDRTPRAEKGARRPSTTTATHSTEACIDHGKVTRCGKHHESNMFEACDGAGSGGGLRSRSGGTRDRSVTEGFDAAGGDIDVRIRVGVDSVGVGAAAKARLYRGYCEQRGGDYDREYRRHGGRETLERIALLNDTFR
ncbi:unnamed protein product [Ectocarpus sp. CCAP 1310/34]|nr:unnamed protein product [Ectocarpus sp. CCAP 1310/34]